MPSTRSGRSHNTSPASATSPAANKKRKADASSPSNSQASKRGKQAKEQKTIEETLDPEPKVDEQKEVPTDDSKQEPATTNGHAVQNGHANDAQATHQPKIDSMIEKNDTTAEQNKQTDKQDVEMADRDGPGQPAEAAKEQTQNEESKPAQHQEAKKEADSKPTEVQEPAKETTAAAASQDAVQTDKHREQAMPSNILEKGIIYFFTRGRVGIDEPESVQDLQRSYLVLRPLPKGGKITDGTVQDTNSNRLLALPKKVWPKSGKDRFMVFVEKAKVSMASLKEEFFQGSEYSTQTAGVRHTPPVSLIGEGVYAVTTTGGGQGTTHLVYMLTVPSEPGQVQSDVGITDKGSFVLSLKNPESSGPSYAQLPEKPDFPKEIIDEFRGRGWMPLHPKQLDYPNAQLLIIGENFESSNNLEPKPKDEQDSQKETPEQELQKLEDEDEHRVEALKGDDTVFADLGLSKSEYGLLTTCKSLSSLALQGSRRAAEHSKALALDVWYADLFTVARLMTTTNSERKLTLEGLPRRRYQKLDRKAGNRPEVIRKTHL